MLKIGKVILGKSPKIVASFGGGISAPVLHEAKRERADVAELRIDLLRSRDPKQVLAAVRKLKHFPVIATIRSEVEGGKWNSSEEKRLELFQAVIPFVQAVDIELSSRFILGLVVRAAKKARKTVIVSYHNFDRTPPLDALLEILEKALEAGADIVKIAVLIRRPEDFRNFSAFTAEHASKNVVTIGMGEKGKMSRVLFPALGSLLTYAHLGVQTAPGQFSLKTMRKIVDKLYRS